MRHVLCVGRALFCRLVSRLSASTFIYYCHGSVGVGVGVGPWARHAAGREAGTYSGSGSAVSAAAAVVVVVRGRVYQVVLHHCQLYIGRGQRSARCPLSLCVEMWRGWSGAAFKRRRASAGETSGAESEVSAGASLSNAPQQASSVKRRSRSSRQSHPQHDPHPRRARTLCTVAYRRPNRHRPRMRYAGGGALKALLLAFYPP